jgi:DNA invertase Pin-like site-specific DNA recombinase
MSICWVFSENISGFSKSMGERQELQDMLKYVRKEGIACIMVSEISRLGRNTRETLTLIHNLEEDGICLYIHNLRITLGADSEKERIFNKLIITIISDIARLESENLSYRIKSGIKNRKKEGLASGRRVGSIESRDKFLAKHKDIQKYLALGRSYPEILKLCRCSMSTIHKVKGALVEVGEE